MARLACLFFLAAVVAYAAGCSRRSLSYIPDGGDGCASLDEAHCKLAAECRADYCSACSCSALFVACAPVAAQPSPCPAYECAQPVCGQCHGLDEQACIAAESALGCAPAYCPDCSGGHNFVSCANPNEGPIACGLFCPAGCHDSNDCSGGARCVAPGAPPGCGVCELGQDCASDGDCAPGRVCSYASCSCTASGKSCVPACNATSCGDGDACGSDGHCSPLSCSSTLACPTHFDCVFPPGPGHPHCQRRACTRDSDCSGGVCVDGGCYAALGTCTMPLP